MRRVFLLALGVVGFWSAPAPLAAQSWTPPTLDMPVMPEIAELSGNWLDPRAPWFDGVSGISGVEPRELGAVGEPRPGSSQAQVVRFSSGPLPVVVWSDRNGDTRADMVEIYKTGNIIIQVIDADYDGRANVLRVYDAAGTLLSEERL
jgi:hypothetical protein